MPNTSKSSRKTQPKAANTVTTEFVETFTPLYTSGVERAAELQKKGLDMAAEQTADWIAAWKNAFSAFPVPTPTFFFDIAGQAVQTCVETQKSVLDVMVEQTQAATEVAGLRAEAYAAIAKTVTTAAKATIARSIEAQKKVLDFAAAQNTTISGAARKQFGTGPAEMIVNTFEQGANTLIQTQKAILEAATEPFVAAE